MVKEWFSRQMINVIWYIQIEQTGEKECTVLLHDSKHYRKDTGHPKEVSGEFSTVETSDGSRILEGVIIKRATEVGFDNQVLLHVTNPENVFNYPTFETAGDATETVAALAALTEPTKITRANVDELLDRGQIETRMASGAWWAIRRNGKTQTWKSQPGRIRIPFKYGMRGYGAITTWDFVKDSGVRMLDGDVVLPEHHLDPTLYRVKPSVTP